MKNRQFLLNETEIRLIRMLRSEVQLMRPGQTRLVLLELSDCQLGLGTVTHKGTFPITPIEFSTELD